MELKGGMEGGFWVMGVGQITEDGGLRGLRQGGKR